MLTRDQYFPGQESAEQVALFIRRHWMAFLPWIILTPVVVLAGMIGTGWMWLNVAPQLTTEGATLSTSEIRTLLIFGSSGLYLSLLFLFLRAWMSYYLDVTIVTERRLIDIEQDGIFGRQIAEQSLLRVQDVSARQVGFFEHLLNYGSLYIETAGEQPNFELHDIPRPNDVAKTILNLHDRLVDSGGHEVEMAIAEGEIAGHRPAPNGIGPRPKKHPLEELRPYFPEPGLSVTSAAPKKAPTKKIETSSLTEGELHEGETVRIQRKS